MPLTLGRVSALITLLFTALSSASAFNAADASNKIGISLLRQISASESGNLLVSPYSLSSVVAPLYLGSEGGTRAELSRVFHFPAQNEEVEQAFAQLVKKLTPSSGVTVDSASMLFVQQGFPVRDTFNKQLRASFGFDSRALDFRNNSAVASINDWVSQQTRGKIPTVVPASLSPETRLLLVNALYFRANWENPFKPELTGPRSFHVNGAEAISDRTAMRRTANMGYIHEDGFQIASLPYDEADYHCLIILPEQLSDSVAAVNRLSAEQLSRWAFLARDNNTLVDLQLPIFTFSNLAQSLTNALKQLGVRQAFDEPQGSANFDSISPRTKDGYLAVSHILQSTFIAVDEKGTEAAAATAASAAFLGAAAGMAPIPTVMHVDRPFLFAIQHAPTGTCLFIGRVTDPETNQNDQ